MDNLIPIIQGNILINFSFHRAGLDYFFVHVRIDQLTEVFLAGAGL